MILIAIGANLPGPQGEPPPLTCQQAADEIRALPNLRFLALSAWYRTAAIPDSSQPDYCNGVIRMEGAIEPAELLVKLQAIEAAHGRVRGQVNAPRTLDLDIIDLNGIIRAVPDPVLPHPRAHLRAFVLRPLLDVAPAWHHPTLQRSVTSLLVDLPRQSTAPWAT